LDREAGVLVAGARGMVGSAIVRALHAEGYHRVLAPGRAELDLLDAQAVRDYLATKRPEYVFVAAAKVGGILANDSFPADFLYQNLMIEAHLIHGAFETGVRKLLFLGSTCIYPRLAPQPLKEEYLLSGPLEPTNEWYAVAKIAGIKLCQAYRRQHGTNLYGPNDNFDLGSSHVLPALIRKFHDAKANGANEVVVWGSGTPLREFLHVDDCAEACVFLMRNYDGYDHVNIGVGSDLSISDLAEMVRKVVGFDGEIILDRTKPDGAPRKLVDTTRINALGWKPRINLLAGVEATYRWFLANS
jgi:GDP-L-fucose synthase